MHEPSPRTASGPTGGGQGARTALALLLGINLFNYIDRYLLAAVEPRVCSDLLGAATKQNLARMGSLVTSCPWPGVPRPNVPGLSTR